MLFVHNEKSSALAHQKHQQQQQEKHRLSPPNRPSDSSRKTPSRKRFIDTLLDTFHDWEGTTRASGGFLDGTLPSGRMSVDFMQYRTAGQGGDSDDGVYQSLSGKSVRTASSSSTAVGVGGGVGVNVHGVSGADGDDDERPDSAKTLTGPHVYEVAQVARPMSARIVTTHGSQSSQDMGFRFDFGQPGGML
jgi:hypothetical protein